MRPTLWVSLCVAVMACGSANAGTITYALTDLGANSFNYTFFVNGFSFVTNEDVSFSFNSLLFGTLSNAVIGNDWALFIAQPHNPPGDAGLFSPRATVDNPSLATPFSIDVTYLGIGVPGDIPYTLNLFDSNLQLIRTVDEGTAQPIPEPAALLLAGTGLTAACALALRRRRPRRSA